MIPTVLQTRPVLRTSAKTHVMSMTPVEGKPFVKHPITDPCVNAQKAGVGTHMTNVSNVSYSWTGKF